VPAFSPAALAADPFAPPALPVAPPGRRLLRLASNEWPGGPTRASLRAIEEIAQHLHRYPDSAGTQLRDLLAAMHGIPADQIVLGSGADELIRLCAVSTLEPRSRVAYPWPSFPTYGDVAVACSAESVTVPLDGDEADVERLATAARDPRVRLVYLANPNNPTGRLTSAGEVRWLADAMPEHCLLVVDEAYVDFCDEPDGALSLVREQHPSVCVLRTFSKLHGLAGLRVGYALASPAVVDVLRRVRPTHSVNAVALAAAAAALDAPELVERLCYAHKARARLTELLRDVGFEALDSQANFVFARTAVGDTARVVRALMSRGVVVRPLDAFGAPDAMRVSLVGEQDWAYFRASVEAATELEALDTRVIA
jgi:histidinol-phosphate aminotransferase